MVLHLKARVPVHLRHTQSVRSPSACVGNVAAQATQSSTYITEVEREAHAAFVESALEVLIACEDLHVEGPELVVDGAHLCHAAASELESVVQSPHTGQLGAHLVDHGAQVGVLVQ